MSWFFLLPFLTFLTDFFEYWKLNYLKVNAKSPISAELSRIKNLKGLLIFWPYFSQTSFPCCHRLATQLFGSGRSVEKASWRNYCDQSFHNFGNLATILCNKNSVNCILLHEFLFFTHFSPFYTIFFHIFTKNSNFQKMLWLHKEKLWRAKCSCRIYFVYYCVAYTRGLRFEFFLCA